MSPISLGVPAFPCRSALSSPRPSMGSALRTGAVFGVVEAVTPLVSWAAGVAAGQAIMAILVEHLGAG